MSNAADLVAKLAAVGTPPELLAAVAQQLFAGESAREIVDSRRKKDRERKPRKSEEVQGTPGNSEEIVEIRDDLSPLAPPLKSTPDPEKITPPLTPHSEDSSAEPTDQPLTAHEIIEGWNDRMVRLGLPAVKRMTPTRQRQLQARIRENSLEDFHRVFDAIERSAFCRGENDRGWRADFDFMLQPKSWTKLLEGAYDH